MKNKLEVSIIQDNVVWKDAETNLINFEKKINKLYNSDIIILPEMFNTGFCMKPEDTAETMDGKTIEWMKQIAMKKESLIIGSLAIVENSQYFNRLIAAFPTGQISFYDKRHLFVLSDEHKNFVQGNQKLIIEYQGWKIKPLICYDLRFPVWARNTEDYDLLIYIANWPESRKKQWRTLLKARAIENQCYCVGVNRIGKDGNKYTYVGDSLLYNAMGEKLFDAKSKDIAATIQISINDLNKAREYFPVLKDADKFNFE